MSLTTPSATADWMTDPDPLRCPSCGGPFAPTESALACTGCSLSFPVRDGVLVVNDDPSADNKITRDFYNSALWPKFRFWEWLFFVCHGGERRARNVILRHLPRQEGLKLLDVAIGDGVYQSWLPGSWSVVGVDVSTGQLAACQRRNAGRDLKLVLGEAESLPFRDHYFDAVLSIGGFNHFSDPEAALREMIRVAQPGAPIVISDEAPDLTNWMLGHLVGLPGIDRWIVSKVMNLGDAFTDLVERNRHIDIARIGRAVLKNCEYRSIWLWGGYLMVGQAP